LSGLVWHRLASSYLVSSGAIKVKNDILLQFQMDLKTLTCKMDLKTLTC
jgi:hypothetical protein